MKTSLVAAAMISAGFAQASHASVFIEGRASVNGGGTGTSFPYRDDSYRVGAPVLVTDSVSVSGPATDTFGVPTDQSAMSSSFANAATGKAGVSVSSTGKCKSASPSSCNTLNSAQALAQITETFSISTKSQTPTLIGVQFLFEGTGNSRNLAGVNDNFLAGATLDIMQLGQSATGGRFLSSFTEHGSDGYTSERSNSGWQSASYSELVNGGTVFRGLFPVLSNATYRITLTNRAQTQGEAFWDSMNTAGLWFDLAPDQSLTFGSASFLSEATPFLSGAVPEPATWAMMIIGFGAAGTALRRRGKAAPALSAA